MPRSWTCLIALCLLVSPLAQAEKLSDFETPRARTEEEIAAEKAESLKSNLSGYGQQVSHRVKPFPWGLVALSAAILLLAAPFAARAFRSTVQEMGAPERVSAGRRAPPPRS
jgi:hypothetical protein